MNIIDPHTMAEHSVAIYKNNKLGLYNDIRQLVGQIEGDYLVEATVIALVTNGHINTIVNDVEHTLQRGDLFACKPNNIVRQSMMSMDFESLVLCISPDYGLQLADEAGIDWTFRSLLQHHEITHLNDFQISNFQHLFNFLRHKILSADTPHKDKCIEHAMISVFYEMLDIYNKVTQVPPQQKYTPKELLMQRFLKILKEDNPINNLQGGYKSVNQYAEQLNVTPKYFSTTCKIQLGKTAGQIIDEEIIQTAKILLHNNSKSIKQISMLLGFANQSHFGTYFSHKTGISPQQYRNGVTK